MSKSNKHIEEIFNRGYVITDDGKIYSPKKKLVKTRLTKDGYPVFTASTESGRWKTYAHKAQAYKKFKEKLFEPGMEVRHLDANRINFALDNLDLGTHRENLLDIDKAIRIAKARHAASVRFEDLPNGA